VKIFKKLGIVFLGPWVILSIQPERFQHHIPYIQTFISGLLEAAVTWLCFLIPLKSRRAVPLGTTFIVLAVIIWNLPAYSFLPLEIGHVEPFIIMLVVAVLYRTGVAMIPELMTWAEGSPRSN
jgi:hypothetical protein